MYRGFLANPDDICSFGQMKVAHDLASRQKPFCRAHPFQRSVGYCRVRSGSQWNQQIYPHVREMIDANTA